MSQRLAVALFTLGCACRLASVDEHATYPCEDGGACRMGFVCKRGFCVDEASGGGSDGGGSSGGGNGGGTAGGSAGGSAGGGGPRRCDAGCTGLLVCGGGNDPTLCALDTHFCSRDGWCWENPWPQGNTLRGLTSTDAGPLWAVGTAGTILGWTGSFWFKAPSPVTADLNAVSAASPTDVWAVGAAGTIVHFDGAAWSVVQSGTPLELFGVYAAPDGGVWAVTGPESAVRPASVRRWTGTGWVDEGVTGLGNNLALRAIHGRSGSDVRAVGDEAIVLEFDGTQWSTTPLPFSQNNAVTVGPDGESWIRGNFGGARKRAGGIAWEMLPAIEPWGYASHVTRDGDVLWAGMYQQIFRQLADAGVATESGITAFKPYEHTHAFGEDGTGQVWAVGVAGRMARRNADAGWTIVSSGDNDSAVRAVWSAASGHGVAVGDGQLFTRNVGGTWRADPVVAGYLLGSLRGVSGWSASEYCIVGETIASPFSVGCVVGSDFHWNTPDGGLLRGAWASPGHKLYFVGDEGVFRSDSDGGNIVGSNCVSGFNAIWGDGSGFINAVGPGGTVCYGPGLSLVPGTHGTADLYGVWGDVSDTWRAGDGGYLRRQLDILNTGTTAGLFAVWGRADNDVYAVGARGTLLFVNDAGLRAQQTGTAYDLYGVFGNDGGETFITGDRGAILRRAR